MDENSIYRSLHKDDFTLYKEYTLDFGPKYQYKVICTFDDVLWEKVLKRTSDNHIFVIEEDLEGCFAYDENNKCLNPLEIIHA